MSTSYAAPCGAIHHLVLEEARNFGSHLMIIGSHDLVSVVDWLGSSASHLCEKAPAGPRRRANCSPTVVREPEALSLVAPAFAAS